MFGSVSYATSLSPSTHLSHLINGLELVKIWSTNVRTVCPELRLAGPVSMSG
jgi:hypothetical protein